MEGTHEGHVTPKNVSCCRFFLLELLFEEVSNHIHDLGLIEVDSAVGSALNIDELRGNAGFLQVLIQDLGLVDRYQVVIGAVENQESGILLVDVSDGSPSWPFQDRS